jgi:hypothetical protein
MARLVSNHRCRRLCTAYSNRHRIPSVDARRRCLDPDPMDITIEVVERQHRNRRLVGQGQGRGGLLGLGARLCELKRVLRLLGRLSSVAKPRNARMSRPSPWLHCKTHEGGRSGLQAFQG